MENLAIAIDDDLLKKARLKALHQGTSVNAVLRDYLAQYAGATSTRQQAVRNVLALSERTRAARGRRRWTRDDLHERR